jgi:SAM-dependent methyltransferase
VRREALAVLRCVACPGDLTLHVDESDGPQVTRGVLACVSCGARYPIAGGVPRFVAASQDPSVESTARNFGAQWQVFDDLGDHHEAQFRDWIAPVTPDFVRGRLVLELGCGKGRHTRLTAQWGAAAVVAVDVSDAVDVAYRHTRDLPNVHVIQADINHLPLARAFDYAFSIGVLHHLEDPAAGFRALVGRVRPGGAVSCWVYGRENNGWIMHGIDPLRRLVFSRLPPRVLFALALLPAGVLFAGLRLLYQPLSHSRIGSRLFYADYLRYIAPFPFREIHTIVYDHLTAPTAFYIARTELARWCDDAGLEDVVIAWHNRNSWRGFGRIASPVAT